MSDHLNSPQRFDSSPLPSNPGYRTNSESQCLTISEKVPELFDSKLKYGRKVKNASLVPSRMKNRISRGVSAPKEPNIASKGLPSEDNPKLVSMNGEALNSMPQVESVEHIWEGIEEFDDNLKKDKNAAVSQNPHFMKDTDKV